MAADAPTHDKNTMRCPAHIGDVDLFGPGAQEHWYEAYPILHKEAPVHRIPGEGYAPGTDGFILSKYEDIALVVRDPVRFPPTLFITMDTLKAQGVTMEDTKYVNAMMVSIASLRPNNELWRSHRQELTDPWVGPGASRHEVMIRKATHELIDRWIDRGEVEFISEFARPLPQMVMANVLGLPYSDIPRLADWGSAQVAAFVYGKGHRNLLNEKQSKEQASALQDFSDYVAWHITERRKSPRDDMITFLTQVEYSPLKRKLNDAEVNGIVYAMMIGGLETTQYALEEQAQLLCDNPDVWTTIRDDRTKVRGFTEECMRLRSPTQGLSTRITSQDEVFQGVHVPKGSMLHLRWAAGNVDPEEWECPFDLNVDRKAVTRHLVFSQGPRVCPGAHISRLEQIIAWEALLDRIEGLEYAPGNKFLHQPGIMLGTLELQLKFKKRAL